MHNRRRSPLLARRASVVATSLSSALLAAWALAPAPGTAAPSPLRTSIAGGGAQAEASSGASALSRDGRFVAFASEAAGLVAGDTNGVSDVFVHDHRTGTTTRVSVGTGGVQATGHSGAPTISADGRVAAFVSRAGDLASVDANGTDPDVFVHDRTTGTTTRVRIDRPLGRGEEWVSFEPSLSADGRHVAFSAVRQGHAGDEDFDAGPQHVYVLDRTRGKIRRVSVNSREQPAGGESGGPAISADGRFVAFDSTAANLVRGDTNRSQDVFVRDRERGTTVRASAGARGTQADDGSFESDISASGRFVVFTSRSGRLVGRGDDRATDVFRRDLVRRRTVRVSGGIDGWSTAPSVSASGRTIAFHVSPTDLVADGAGPVGAVYVRDLGRRAARRVTTGTRSGDPDLSGDGRRVAFTSLSALVPGDTNGVADVFVSRLRP